MKQEKAKSKKSLIKYYDDNDDNKTKIEDL